MCGRSRLKVKVEPRSTLTFKRGLTYSASVLFTRIKVTWVRTEILRDSRKQPLVGM